MATYLDISPSLGHALVTAQGQPGGYDAIDDRAFWGVGKTEGIVELSDGAWLVEQRSAGANMSVDVATNVGHALVQGDTVDFQGLYLVRPHSAAANLDVGTADGSLPRIDQIVLEVKDDEHDSSGLTRARVYVLAGTPTSGATKENMDGAASVPASTMVLAAVQVDAAASSITGSDILDLRTNAIPSSDSSPWRVDLGIFLGVATNTGFALSTSASLIGAASWTSSAQNDEIGWDIQLDAGTWDLHMLVTKTTDRGIITASIDGTDVGTIDTYAGSASNNNTMSITNIVVADTGVKRLLLKAATKNASSSGYTTQFNGLALVRTA